MKKRKWKKLFVVYATEGSLSWAIGHATAEIDKKIKRYEDIKNIAEHISKKYCEGKNVCVLDWKYLKMDGRKRNDRED